MRAKKILLEAASIINLFILLIFFPFNSMAEDHNMKYFSQDLGTLVLMYHRFNEPKYPTTNIQMDIFKNQIKNIKNEDIKFLDPKNFDSKFDTPKQNKKILITIDDGFSSFYKYAWPFFKKNEIPFILFISTEAVGKKGYMNWQQIKEIEKQSFVYIGNHSHSHDYLVDMDKNEFFNDIDTSIKTFKRKLGYNPIFFSYPFGEYNEYIKNYIKKKFKYSFGQHSGVIDINKNKFELPRFPINEKYGDIKRFNFLIKLHPLQYKKMLPEEKYLDKKNNPPNFSVEFFKSQRNLNRINCFSNENNIWKKSITSLNNNVLKISFRDKFLFRRGRVNCSLNDDGIWRWVGFQFTIKKN